MHPHLLITGGTHRGRRLNGVVARRPICDEQGVALIIALLSMTLLLALGMALVMTTMTETRIASNYTSGTEAFYAADAAVERVMDEILTVPDWNQILNGSVQSAFIDGPPSGERTLPDGTKLDLSEATNLLRCGKVTTCSDADMNTSTAERPWGANNPRWQPYAYGPMADMIGTGTINSNMYVIAWIADDPSEDDGLPLTDGGAPAGCDPKTDPTCVNNGKGVISMMAQAYGPNGLVRTIEVTLARTDTTEMERGYTGQRGQDEQNRRARKAPVQSPGKALTHSQMSLASGGLVQTP